MKRRLPLWIFFALFFASSFFAALPSFAQTKIPTASVASSPVSSATSPTISLEKYRARLQTAQDKLQKLEEHPPRLVAPILAPLAQAKTVRRKDGQTQKAGGDELGFYLTQPAYKASREQTRELRESLALRLKALDAWERSTLASVGAQNIVAQLESSGQIRTGPTRLQQWRSDFRRWWQQIWKNLMNWLGGLFPTPKAPTSLPQPDMEWIRVVFMVTVGALLVAIAFLVWRAVGGKIGRKSKMQQAFAFSPEEAELLLLPPDELRLRARKFATDGNFREALRHLYIALLLTLDARGVWRYDARRTNWEHIAALKTSAERSTLVAPLSEITRRFDRVRYGNAECAQNDWLEFERDVSALEASTPP